MFGLGESPLLLRDDKKAEKSDLCSRPIETESINNRVATVGVKYKPSAEHLIPTLFRWRVAPPTRRSDGSDPRRQVDSNVVGLKLFVVSSLFCLLFVVMLSLLLFIVVVVVCCYVVVVVMLLCC